jgi:hypothetical protein
MAFVTWLVTSVGKTEIKSFRAHFFAIVNAVSSFLLKKLSDCIYKHNDTSSKSRTYFFGHFVPLLIAALVAKHKVDFGENENPNDQDIDDDKVTIAPTIQWAIIRTIYEVRTHIAELDHHYRHVRTCRECRPPRWVMGLTVI